MRDILALYRYIADNYDNYREIKLAGEEISVVFYDGFEMKIKEQNFFNFYFNDIFFYGIDWQDVKGTIDEFFTDKCVFCEKNRKFKVIYAEDYRENNKFDRVWTIKKALK